MIKIWRSWKSAFGEFSREFIPEQEESWNVTDIYTDGELERIRRAGFNAVWVHAQLNHIVRTGIFPELGEYAVEFRKRLNILTERAARHGIGIYLYLQVPRGLPQGHPLWKKHPECAGMPDIYSDTNGNPVVMIPMCTSMPATRKYLQCAAEELARRLPRLAGVILITASEYPSHCYGRGGRMVPDGDRLKFIPVDCPHCLERTPAEVITEVIGIVSGGIHAVAPQMRVIAWNWSWTFFEESPCPNLIRRLPRDVNLLIDFERGGLRRNGATLEEYSLGYAGPSERFRLACGEARKHGLEVFAKFQLGTTHELAVVPNLPLLENIRRKASRFSALNLNGFMGCWNFGNMPSANVTAFNIFWRGRRHRLKSSPPRISPEATQKRLRRHGIFSRRRWRNIRFTTHGCISVRLIFHRLCRWNPGRCPILPGGVHGCRRRFAEMISEKRSGNVRRKKSLPHLKRYFPSGKRGRICFGTLSEKAVPFMRGRNSPRRRRADCFSGVRSTACVPTV